MALKIRTTGIEDFLDGSANIKMMIVGGPDVGKTRSASYWPRPFYLDCEKSRGSLRDRKMPFVEITSSADMLDALEYLKRLERTPKADREYQTVVVDTLDSFQRKVKDEWLRDNNEGVFRGYDAWGYLDAKLQMLLTRLLNLDYNVIVNVHWVRERGNDDDGPRQYALQLDGKIQNQIFNDFDLVGRMGTYWSHDAITGEKVEKRGLTFKKDTEWSFLKDRFALFSERWLPITFSDEDYNQISRAFAESADAVEMPDAEEVGEIPTADVTYTRDVVAPMAGGPVPPRPPKERKLADLTKPELMDKAKELGLNPKANWVKAELVVAIENHKAAESQPTPARPADSPPTPEPTQTSDEEPAQQPEPVTEPAQESDAPSASPEPEGATVHQLPVQPQPEPDHDTAVETAKEELGATVIAEQTSTPEPKSVPTIGGRPATNCDDCNKDLAGEKFNYVQLAWFKHRKLQCNHCYETALKAAQ